MDLTIHPCALHGTICAIPSKSQAHRLLLCAAFADGPTCLPCAATNQDMEATAACLRALGAEISYDGRAYRIQPIQTLPQTALLPCGESGSTLRFLLPVVGALGVDGTFSLEGRLPQRPLSPLWEEMERMGCRLSRPSPGQVRCQGRLRGGLYRIRGDVSSQFVTGLLFALSLCGGESRLELVGSVESLPYIQMTLKALERFGCEIPHRAAVFSIRPAALHSPGLVPVEGDWSNAAFWLGAAACGSDICLTGLDASSAQGDRAVTRILPELEKFQEIDASQIPDLVPVLAVVAGAKQGARFVNAGRLRIKESDRLETTAALIRNLGGAAQVQGDTLTVAGTGYQGGIVHAAGDHRIAMAAAIASTVCSRPVTVCGAEAVRKSYPGFWNDFEALGGILCHPHTEPF